MSGISLARVWSFWAGVIASSYMYRINSETKEYVFVFVLIQVAINERNMSDNSLEELSLAREPRTSSKDKGVETGEANLPKFSEWAAGRQSSLDTDTLSQHVTQMVDVCSCVHI